VRESENETRVGCTDHRTYGFITFCFLDQRVDAETKLRDLVRGSYEGSAHRRSSPPCLEK
jgi:hypothetical protein